MGETSWPVHVPSVSCRARVCESQEGRATRPTAARDHDKIFRRSLGTHTFDADLERAGITKTTPEGAACFHSLRKSFTTFLQINGASVREAQSFAKHSDPRLTANVYTDPTMFRARAAADGITALVRGAHESAHEVVPERPRASSDVTIGRDAHDGASPEPDAGCHALSRDVTGCHGPNKS